MEQEGQEVGGLEQIIKLAQSGSPQALPQIGQIATQMLQAQQAEMQGMQGAEQAPEQAPEQGLREKLMQAGGQE